MLCCVSVAVLDARSTSCFCAAVIFSSTVPAAATDESRDAFGVADRVCRCPRSTKSVRRPLLVKRVTLFHAVFCCLFSVFLVRVEVEWRVAVFLLGQLDLRRELHVPLKGMCARFSFASADGALCAASLQFCLELIKRGLSVCARKTHNSYFRDGKLRDSARLPSSVCVFERAIMWRSHVWRSKRRGDAASDKVLFLRVCILCFSLSARLAQNLKGRHEDL